MPTPKQRKIAVVGSRSVGKSSLTVRLCDGHFVDSYYPTIENTFSKIIKYKNHEYATEIVDTAGTDEYSILSSKHFIGIHGYMLVYSIASRQSFEQIRILQDKILNHLVRPPSPPFHLSPGSIRDGNDGPGLQSPFTKGAEKVPLMIVGNKCDLKTEQRRVSTQEGEKLANEFNCAFTEASARENRNVNHAFESAIGEIEKSQNPEQPPGGNKCLLM